MKSIDIKETTKDRNTWFNVKRLNIQGLSDNFFVKTFDLNNLNNDLATNLVGNRVIFEKSKWIRNPNTISEIAKETDNNRIKAFFGWRRWLDDRFWINNSTFVFNPYKEIQDLNDIESFLSYYYEFSKNFVFVPNIKKFKYIYPSDSSKGIRAEVIDSEGYLNFVEKCVSFFSNKNNKPIFVPISISFSIDEIKRLISEYVKKEWFYFWIDFESQPIDEVQTARVKTINSLFERNGYFDKTISFFTNIKREIISKRKADFSPASDVLGTIYGANIVGIDREPPKPQNSFSSNKPSKREIVEHKAREFDARTYYYVKNSNGSENKHQNITNNSVRLSNEFLIQRQYFLEKMEISNYLSTKQMIVNFSNGKILSDIKRVFTTQSTLDLV